MLHSETAIPVIGAAFSNPQGAARRAAIARCTAGEPVHLQREPRAVGGAKAVGVYSSRGEQIGYVPAEQAQWIGGQLADIRAIFQRADTFGAVVRVTFDGSDPILPTVGLEGVSRKYPPPAAGGDDDDWPPPEPRDDFGEI